MLVVTEDYTTFASAYYGSMDPEEVDGNVVIPQLASFIRLGKFVLFRAGNTLNDQQSHILTVRGRLLQRGNAEQLKTP